MSLISFLKDAGEKLFRHAPEQAPAAPAAAVPLRHRHPTSRS